MLGAAWARVWPGFSRKVRDFRWKGVTLGSFGCCGGGNSGGGGGCAFFLCASWVGVVGVVF